MDNKEMEMSLDEAIEHLNETLNSTDRMWSCDSCRREHEQLRNWLIELREMKNKYYIPVPFNSPFLCFFLILKRYILFVNYKSICYNIIKHRYCEQ